MFAVIFEVHPRVDQWDVPDYGMFDRRKAPQYYPDADGADTLHSWLSSATR
jgi:hypothetical protein